MINTSSQLNRPVKLYPCLKDYIWGGRRLIDEFAKAGEYDVVAESWECSTNDNGLSRICGGKLDGTNLKECIGDFSLIIKLIDADKNLSIQVHPSGELGKTEMWYILDANEDAYIYYGLKKDMDADAVRMACEKGNITRYLNKVKVKKNEVYFIPAGLIHAIGKGVCVAEIQQNSDVTYRLFDYDRIDYHTGRKRPLHIDKALECAKLVKELPPIQPMRVLQYAPGLAREFLIRCRYFYVERLLLNTGDTMRVHISNDASKANCMLCIQGSASLICDSEAIDVKKGDCIYIPQHCDNCYMSGSAVLLLIHN